MPPKSYFGMAYLVVVLFLVFLTVCKCMFFYFMFLFCFIIQRIIENEKKEKNGDVLEIKVLATQSFLIYFVVILCHGFNNNKIT